MAQPLTGNLRKLNSENQKEVQYYLPLGEKCLHLNPKINENISIRFTKKIHCNHCKKLTKKSFAQGYCYRCFMSLPETDISIVHPEKDLSHIGISRDMEWAKRNSLKPHYVYLSYTSDCKIGVTREKNIPSRWIDQGAIAAIKIAKTPNRHIAGVTEVYLKRYFKDKTSWSKMLSIQTMDKDLRAEKNKVISLLHPELKQYVISDEKIHRFNYPITSLSDSYASIQLEKHSQVEGKLAGIKGQYLIFAGGQVLNVRRHSGYEITFTQP